MSSPFTGFNNAILKLPSGTQTMTVNPETGNYEFSQAIEEYKVILMLRNEPLQILPDGVDNTTILIRGYLVNPQFFPHEFSLPTTVDCTFLDINGRKTDGKLDLEIIPDPFKVGEITGQRLQGTFKVLGEGNVTH